MQQVILSKTIMTIPTTWEEMQSSCPVFLINMEKDVDRKNRSINRIAAAGYKNIQVVKGVDGRSRDLLDAWDTHGNPKFDPVDGWFNDPVDHPHKQGTLVTHMNIWKKMIDEQIPFATIFEDDVLFHEKWEALAPAYYNATPRDYGICYIGHHCGVGPSHIVRVPVYTTHAYMLTLEGVTYIYNKMLTDPNGVRTIDCLLNYYMQIATREPSTFCNWYAWNAEMFPDTVAKKYPQHAHKDQGLVFQEHFD